jgi:hypothetical protein
MSDETDDPKKATWTWEEETNPLSQVARKIIAEYEEEHIWEPARPAHLMEGEMFGDPPLFSERVYPEPGFPYRAMSEDEVRVLARGIGQMISNARRAEEDAYRQRDSEMDCYYRGQAQKLHDVLKLLERVLRGTWPRSDA